MPRCLANRRPDERDQARTAPLVATSAHYGRPVPDLSPPLPPGGYVELPGRGRAWVWDTGCDGRPTALLIHGWTSTSALTWCRCFAGLERDYRVVAMDLRGHGRGIRSRWPFRLEDCADDIAVLVELLDLGPVVATGYSMGGPVAQLLWQRHPECVRGLVLGATATRFPSSTLPDAAVLAAGVGLSLALSAVPAPIRREGFRRFLRTRPAHQAMATWAAEESEAGELIGYIQAGVAINRYDATNWINTVDVPTAIIVTSRDTVVPPSSQRRMAAAIPGATTLEVDATHRACVDAARQFVPVLTEACRIVTGRPHPSGLAGPVAEPADPLTAPGQTNGRAG
jgi:3-oxoadipate enol-lactonase